MNALDSVLAELVDVARDCAYVTIKRAPLESLIQEWAQRGDQIAVLSDLLTQARRLLSRGQHSPCCNANGEAALRILNSAIEEPPSALVQHRHAIRRELAARIKQVLRTAIAEVGRHATDALLAGETELAERLESERRTVRIVMSTIDAIVERLVQQELRAAQHTPDQERDAASAA